MERDRTNPPPEREPPEPREPGRHPGTPPERAERPAPGVRHEPEPDAENIIPVKDEPGTL